jgi:4-hydroxy-3-methylbut-2-enyl diphosphate reductase
VVFAALDIESRALRRGAPGLDVRRIGIGPRRAAAAAGALAGRLPQGCAERDSRPVVVAGFGAAAQPGLRAGDVVVAGEVRGPDGAVTACPAAGLLAAALRRHGLTAHVGPLTTVPRLTLGRRARVAAAASGTLALDMESAPLIAAAAAAGRAVAALRVVVDGPEQPLLSPSVLRAGLAARRALTAAAPAVADWAAAAGGRQLLLAGPRSFCAGVERAIDIVERALDLFPHPVYVRKQIVHNSHVVADLQRRGAVFVDELDEVPDGATVVFSAHGVAPAVWQVAQQRGLDVVDATCPLVAKVHAEARRFTRRGDTVFLIGHAGHEEVEGELGEAPEGIRLVQTVEEARMADIPAGRPVSYLMQTTLAVDEATTIVDALRERAPDLRGPSSDDICYATSNRQEAVRAVARDADVTIVLGSPNSSNSRRLVEIAARSGRPAYLVEDESELDPLWLVGRTVVGVTAGASAPPDLVDRLIAALGGLGPVSVSERSVATETVSFNLPKEVS